MRDWIDEQFEPIRRAIRPVTEPIARGTDRATAPLKNLYFRLPPILRTGLYFIILISLPYLFSPQWERVFVLIALYVVLGLGLNVVVGYAGLLDLGYVAFFAVGAYFMALTTSPASPIDISLNFWFILPASLVLGATIGLLLGLPVLPLRGDYLAIVTLAFGEIIRIFIVNQSEFTNGSQGIPSIGKPDLFGNTIDSFTEWYFFILIVATGVAFVTSRLADARIGRAWEAIREDEDVAASMGINTTKYKLMAFATGAAIGAFGGVLYASFTGFINPGSFTLQVSINVLAIVIIGGMGSVPGIVIGSIILIGMPEILQFSTTADFLAHFEFLADWINSVISAFNKISPWDISELPPSEEWGQELARKRFIVFGALLVIIMILRPSGIFPSKRRQMEFENPPQQELAGQV